MTMNLMLFDKFEGAVGTSLLVNCHANLARAARTNNFADVEVIFEAFTFLQKQDLLNIGLLPIKLFYTLYSIYLLLLCFLIRHLAIAQALLSHSGGSRI